MLAIMTKIVPIGGQSRVNPSVYFRPMAQATSSPAAIKVVQGSDFSLKQFRKGHLTLAMLGSAGKSNTI
jgi:hypothetical protein